MPEPSLYNPWPTRRTKISIPKSPAPVEAFQSQLNDSDAFCAARSLIITPSPSPRASIDAKRGAVLSRKRRSPSSCDSIDSQYCDERVKVQCHHATEAFKSEKKAAKERAHRDGESLYRQTQEDMIVNYFDFRPSAKLAKGNKISSGLEFAKATMQRAYIVVSAKLIDDSFKRAIEEDRVDEWRRQWQQRIEDHVGDDERLLEGTLLDIPNEPRCCHANAKQQACSTHGHKDWTECRRGRYRAAFQDNSESYRLQAMADATYSTIH
nr:hypothetical protein CFP56_43885 [Quercus suber]